MSTPAPTRRRQSAFHSQTVIGMQCGCERTSAREAWSESTDEELIAMYRQSGESKVFEALIRRYEQEIYRYLRRYIGNSEMAEDAFQGTFLQVHLKCQQFDSTRRFRPWLYAIATNQAIDVGRRNKRHRMVSLDQSHPSNREQRAGTWGETLVGTTPDPHTAAARTEEGRWVDRAVGSLGDPMRQVIQLVYFQGLKYREAAEALGIPVGTVKSRLHAAVSRLSLLWEETHQNETDERSNEGDPILEDRAER